MTPVWHILDGERRRAAPFVACSTTTTQLAELTTNNVCDKTLLVEVSEVNSLFRSRRYELLIPEGWGHERVSASDVFFKIDDGQGAINVSSLVAPPSADPKQVFNDIAKGAPPRVFPSEQSDVQVLSAEFLENGLFWRCWVFWRSPTAVCFTYNCDESRMDDERGEVDRVIESVRLMDSAE